MLAPMQLAFAHFARFLDATIAGGFHADTFDKNRGLVRTALPGKNSSPVIVTPCLQVGAPPAPKLF